MTDKSNTNNVTPFRNFEVITNKERTKVRLQSTVEPLLFKTGDHPINLSESYKRSTRDEEVEIANKAKGLKELHERYTDSEGIPYPGFTNMLINTLEAYLQNSISSYIQFGNTWMIFRLYLELILLLGDKISKNVFMSEPEFARYTTHLFNDLENLLMVMSLEERRGVIRFLLENKNRIYDTYSLDFEEALEGAIVSKISVTGMAPEMINYTDFVIRNLLKRRKANDGTFNANHFGYILTWFFSFLLTEGFELDDVIGTATLYKAYPYMPEWIEKAYFLKGDYEGAFEFLDSFSQEEREVLEDRSVDYGTESNHFRSSLGLFLKNSLYDDKLEHFEKVFGMYLEHWHTVDLSDLLVMYREYGDQRVFGKLLELVLTSQSLSDQSKKATLEPLNIEAINFEFFKADKDLTHFKLNYTEFLDTRGPELMPLYLELVKPLASTARKRSDYKTLAQHLKWGLENLQGGEAEAAEIAEAWAKEYPRKYAFHDELKKAGFLKDS